MKRTTLLTKTHSIYRITCTKTNRSYVGRSVNVGTRFYFHKHSLVHGTHKNKELQTDANRHGLDSLKLEILVQGINDYFDAKKAEQDHIRSTKNAYNVIQRTTTREQFDEIRRLLGQGVGLNEIARRVRTNANMVWRVKHNQVHYD